jgi:hypothetical protein
MAWEHPRLDSIEESVWLDLAYTDEIKAMIIQDLTFGADDRVHRPSQGRIHAERLQQLCQFRHIHPNVKFGTSAAADII